MNWKGIMFSSDKENQDGTTHTEVADNYNSNLTSDDIHPTPNSDFGLNGFESDQNACKVCKLQ